MKINLLVENSNWKKKLLKGFNTKRLVLKPFVNEDLEPVLKISGENELFKYVADISHSYDLEKWLKFVQNKKNYLIFTINGGSCEYQDELMGVLMLNKKNNTIEIGGWFGTKFQKKGYGSETVAGLIKKIKQMLPDMHFYAEIREDNFAAMRLLDVDGIERKVHRCHRDNDSDFKL